MGLVTTFGLGNFKAKNAQNGFKKEWIAFYKQINFYDEVRYVAIYSLNANIHVYVHVDLHEIYLYNVKQINFNLATIQGFGLTCTLRNAHTDLVSN